jgi:hypothetical protein
VSLSHVSTTLDSPPEINARRHERSKAGCELLDLDDVDPKGSWVRIRLACWIIIYMKVIITHT